MLNRIIYFLKTTFSIYDTYLTNKSKLGKYIVFCEVDKKSNKIKVLTCANLFADVMHSVNNNQSINPYFIK